MRIIPRIDIKEPNLIKSIHLEGLKKLGEPAKFLKKDILKKELMNC